MSKGFAKMDADTVRKIAAKGGRAAHAKGTAHEYSPAEARENGRKGGLASGAARRLRMTTTVAATEEETV